MRKPIHDRAEKRLGRRYALGFEATRLTVKRSGLGDRPQSISKSLPRTIEVTITKIEVAWELKKAGHSAQEIADQLGKDRSTIYRWLKGLRMYGLRGYQAYFRQAKRGRRVRQTQQGRSIRYYRCRARDLGATCERAD